ncbi:MAG: SDR family NAD(P)-dependent oxidoreductase, partial [Acidimicrobiales bacterium]
MGRVDGKVALITGAGRGQGRSHAVRLAEEGADIIAIDACQDIDTNEYPLARAEDLRETGRLVEKHGRRVLTIEADVRDLPTLKREVRRGVEELGGLHVVCANAGICPLGTGLPLQAWSDAIDVDLTGVNNTLSATLDLLPDGASIILTGSVAGLLTTSAGGVPGAGGAGYAFAKQTIVNLVRSL